MSALDQAFIKAYVQQSVAPPAAIQASVRPVPLSRALEGTVAERGKEEQSSRSAAASLTGAFASALETSRSDSTAGKKRGKAVASEVPAPKRGKSSKQSEEPAASSKASAGSLSACSVFGLPEPPASVAASSESARKETGKAASTASRGTAGSRAKAKAAPVAPATIPLSAARSASPVAEPVVAPRVAEAMSVVETASESEAASFASTENGIVFQPQLQVDSLAWPAIVTRLLETQGGPLDPLVDHLMLGLMRGRRVVAVGGCRQGDGCTTIASAAAKRLAQRGVHVVLVDADFEHPRVARRLGLAPEAGWESVLTGRSALESVLIQSLYDDLVLLPAVGALPGMPEPELDWVSPSESINTLLRHFDLILVDVGQGGSRRKIEMVEPEALADWIHAMVLVHNTRAVSPTELAQVGNRYRDAGVKDVTVVENFVSC